MHGPEGRVMSLGPTQKEQTKGRRPRKSQSIVPTLPKRLDSKPAPEDSRPVSSQMAIVEENRI